MLLLSWGRRLLLACVLDTRRPIPNTVLLRWYVHVHPQHAALVQHTEPWIKKPENRFVHLRWLLAGLSAVPGQRERVEFYIHGYSITLNTYRSHSDGIKWIVCGIKWIVCSSKLSYRCNAEEATFSVRRPGWTCVEITLHAIVLLIGLLCNVYTMCGALFLKKKREKRCRQRGWCWLYRAMGR